MTKDLYILDVSGFVYRAYFALPPMSNKQGEATHALFGFIRSVVKLFKEFGPSYVVAVFDGPDNKKQRKELYDKYKAHRPKAAEDLPSQIARAKEFCTLSGIPEIEIGGVEADDTIGSIAKWASREGMRVFLCTSDKDLCQLVNEQIFVVNPWKEYTIFDAKKVEETFGVPPEKIADLLALMGDPSDNIPGVRGIGPKTAISLLKDYGSLEDLLENSHTLTGAKAEALKQEADIARLSKRLATIHTDIPLTQDATFFQKRPPDLVHLRDFYVEMEFSSFLQELDTSLSHTKQQQEKIKEETKNYLTIDNQKSLSGLISTLKEAREICFSIETTHTDPMQALIVGIGFSVGKGEAFYLPFNGNLSPDLLLKELKALFEDPSLSFYGHNVKDALHVLKNVGMCIFRISFDTHLASYLLHPEERRHTLDHLALHYFEKIKITAKSLLGTGKKEISMQEAPIDKVSHYACENADYTWRLKQLLEKELLTRKLLALFYDLDLPLLHVLFNMEQGGIFLDSSKLEKMSVEIKKELSVLEKEIFAIADCEFNIASPQQLSKVLFEKLGIKPLKKTATGHSTNAEVLETLALEHPIAQKLLEYRGLDKLCSTYVDALPKQINAKTGRIHPTFNQSVTATGRLSCQDPNLQNIPVRSELGKKIREAFCPEKKSWSYLAADYSQIELRLLAHFSEDPSLIRAFQEGEDIHRLTASLVFNLPYAEVKKKEREFAKAINFGIIYGQQAFGLSKQLGIDVTSASSFIHAYFERYPYVRTYIDHCIHKTKAQGKAYTMLGREREIPEIKSNNMHIRSLGMRLAINTPLQGSAAELIKMAMLKIDNLLKTKKMQSFMILQVHDELIFEAPDEELKELSCLVKEAMEGAWPLKVPLVADVTIGKNWGEC